MTISAGKREGVWKKRIFRKSPTTQGGGGGRPGMMIHLHRTLYNKAVKSFIKTSLIMTEAFIRQCVVNLHATNT